MDKETFYEILCEYTPEQLNELISSKGKKKPCNAVTFRDIEDIKNQIKENVNERNR